MHSAYCHNSKLNQSAVRKMCHTCKNPEFTFNLLKFIFQTTNPTPVLKLT